MSDYELLRAVMYSRDALQDTANKAQARLDEMKQEFKALLKEQEAIVEAAEKMRSDYAEESLRWEMSPNRGLPPGSSYTVKKKMGVYTRNRGTMMPLHYPWMPWTPASAPAPKPAKKRKIINDSDSSEEEDEVAVTGERSWNERDRDLRAKAIPLDSCVDEVCGRSNCTDLRYDWCDKN